MPSPQLNHNDKATIRLADSSAIRNALTALKPVQNPPWLKPGNSFLNSSSMSPTFVKNNAAELIEITAIKGPLHAIDGWSCVGRSLNALINGDAHGARHLAYYGELRGALSILASSGIAVFNRVNAVIDANGSVHHLAGLPTHQICWLALSEWASSSNRTEDIIATLQIGGMPLLQLARSFFPSGVSIGMQDLMNAWGFDLARGADDRDARNASSYQPTALIPIRTNPADDAEFLKDMWGAIRPNEISLERHLLRIFLERQAAINNDMISAYKSIHDGWSDSLKSSITFDFLSRTGSNETEDHPIIKHGTAQQNPAHPYSMICRATLLLKIATSLAERNLTLAGLKPREDLEIWWQEFGEIHGLWSPGSAPGSSQELWDDVFCELEDLETAPTTHRHEWLSALKETGVRICKTERAALWGLFQ